MSKHIFEINEITSLDWEVQGVTDETTFDELVDLFEKHNEVLIFSEALIYFRNNASDVYKIEA